MTAEKPSAVERCAICPVRKDRHPVPAGHAFVPPKPAPSATEEPRCPHGPYLYPGEKCECAPSATEGAGENSKTESTASQEPYPALRGAASSPAPHVPALTAGAWALIAEVAEKGITLRKDTDIALARWALAAREKLDLIGRGFCVSPESARALAKDRKEP